MLLLNITVRVNCNGSCCMTLWIHSFESGGITFAGKRISIYPDLSFQLYKNRGRPTTQWDPNYQVKPEMRLHPPCKTHLNLPEHNTCFPLPRKLRTYSISISNPTYKGTRLTDRTHDWLIIQVFGHWYLIRISMRKQQLLFLGSSHNMKHSIIQNINKQEQLKDRTT
jgi:hypothetical protein